MKHKFINKCDWYLDGFCCRDLDAGRVWDCIAHKNLKQLLKYKGTNKQEGCEYFRKIKE